MNQEKLIRLRRHIHAHPELSFQEYNTADFIEVELKKIGIVDIQRMGNTGIIALIKGKNPNAKCIALRADIDALPIQEENTNDYVSKHKGSMHACGHDVHTTCLIGAAELLWNNRNELNGTVKLIFQPGEEQSPGGASILINEGVLNNPEVQAIIGLHVSPDLKVGTLGFCEGPYMASSDEIHLTFLGNGGHAAAPHLTADTITMAALFITNIHSSLARLNNPLNPFVLTFGHINGGSTTNVIPTNVSIKGTLRTFDESWRQTAIDQIHILASSICNQMSGSYELKIPSGYPFLRNDINLTRQIKNIMKSKDLYQFVELPQRMSSEDFAFYAQKIPACFFRLGTQSEDGNYSSPVHTPIFDVDEKCLSIGAQTFYEIAKGLLNT